MRIKGNNPNCNLFFAYRDIKNIVIIFVILNQSSVLMVMFFLWPFFIVQERLKYSLTKALKLSITFIVFFETNIWNQNLSYCM